MKTCDCLRQFKTNKGLLIHKRKKHGLHRTRQPANKSSLHNLPVLDWDRGLPIWDIPINFDLCGE